MSSGWGSLNIPNDSDTIEKHLESFCNESMVVVCELGIERGHTGNMIVSILKKLGVPCVKYYGVDNLNYHKWEHNTKTEKNIDFQHPEMIFVEGDYRALSSLEEIDFGFIRCYQILMIHQLEQLVHVLILLWVLRTYLWIALIKF